MAKTTVPCMTAGQINKALDRLDKLSSKITDAFIEAGRGSERPSEISRMTDPLARKYQKLSDERGELRNEIAMRMGPGSTRRLPRGFGPLPHRCER